ncbi:bifunctional 4-hydroxy-2-oxoglutarate aldolase/2-dehydro-3-deoxy-phosphogluconate aldolase [Galbibacter pacificus]|uniref:Bifunctional 4-hydroxy-2-oxoglutarate aldolase/2-dehydro-3-deoxy-phosphogluconate aldolase n=1 Tax=Galbibacter pacificus TaxID=2996052 RepID=A0ABT6FP94_9FLAO|nr:bifunctional 4-hydroxy-2-oxoglutarate aldolase/2-dehydro-3-deoxy-phosphogluconate aldolase [Galbibacter pacificus]MDG3581595.1 bifunctional 4-hydroxy-2-oxoglutarate aldolase/2-dehydro-3-deoxy-phosphogluconate aldolase [Galbibacter pacificus]MDG3585073.1 bifunctional 4-hydroxy-2-oxoglutarate aldolase/2-dehydro-3-deoxy-phosphogluconate aldolase [Galbibacter pacificus]
MKTYTRIEVAKTMESTGLVPLFYHPDKDVVCQAVKACYDGGARLFEFTARGALAHEVFSDLVKYCGQHCPDMILGVGSVTDAASASLYIQLGAQFIVTPVFREDIAIACNRRKILWAPGCGTLTEIAKAEEFGCEIVKLFPGATYGPSFVKAIKGPCPWTSIMPTGGVSPDEKNITDWFNAGVTCVGMGSKLISKEIIEKGDYKKLEKNVEAVLNMIKKAKK